MVRRYSEILLAKMLFTNVTWRAAFWHLQVDPLDSVTEGCDWPLERPTGPKHRHASKGALVGHGDESDSNDRASLQTSLLCPVLSSAPGRRLQGAYSGHANSWKCAPPLARQWLKHWSRSRSPWTRLSQRLWGTADQVLCRSGVLVQ